MKGRRVDLCASCGEEAEIAGFGMCYKCYRRTERIADAQKEGWNPGQRTQKKMQRAYSAIERALVVECGLSHRRADNLIRMLSAYVRPLAEYLGERAPEEVSKIPGPDVVNTLDDSRSQPESQERQGDANTAMSSRSGAAVGFMEPEPESRNNENIRKLADNKGSSRRSAATGKIPLIKGQEIRN